MDKTRSTTQLIDIFTRTLDGQNFSPKTIRVYGDDLAQFTGWLQTVCVDWDNPKRLGRADVEAFLHHLSGRNLTGVSRARKLAAIRKFFAFLHENGMLQTNPAAAVKGVRREEKEPAKEQYKAILYEASESPRDYAIIMTFLQTGIRLSELAGLTLEDVDFENRMLTVRQGKGKKDRQIPLVDASWLLSAGQCQTAAPLPVGSDPRSVPRNEPAHKAPPPSSPALGNYAKGLPAAGVLLRRNRTDRPLQ
jgi:integrase/recombinase XerC